MQTSSITSGFAAVGARRDSSLRVEPWCTTTLWWPVEVVQLRVEVVEPRKLTALEWVLLRIVEEFGAEAPSLQEAGVQLGLGDATFLEATLPALRTQNMLEPRLGFEGEDLAALTFTDGGHLLYRKGQIEGVPAKHGVTFYLDAITDEALEPDIAKALQPAITNGFVVGEVGEPRTSLGLHRTEELMRRMYRDIMRGDTELRAVEAKSDTGMTRWRPVEVSLGLASDGQLIAEADAISARAREFLLSRDPVSDGIVPPCPVTRDWLTPASDDEPVEGSSSRSPATLAVLPFTQFRREVTRLVPAAEVSTRALTLIAEARTELVLDVGWFRLVGVADQVERALRKGVRVLVVGGTPRVAWHGRSGVRLEIEPSPSEHPTQVSMLSACLLIADGDRGLALTSVEVRHGTAPVVIEAVGVLEGARAEEACKARVDQALLASRKIWSLALPRYASSEWQDAESETARWLESPPIAAALARLAFRPVPAMVDEIVQGVSSLAGPVRALLLRSLLHRCRDLAPHLDFGRLQAAWCAARDALLIVDDIETDDLEERAVIAASLLSRDAAETWSLHVLQRVAAPTTLADIPRYGARIAPLRRLAAAGYTKVVTAALRPLTTASPADAATFIGAVGGLLPPESLADLLLEGATLEAALGLREAFAHSNVALTDRFWRAQLESRLPAWEMSFSGAEHGPEIILLEQALRFPAGRAALWAWAGRIADRLAAPQRADGLAWWLGELAALAPALSDTKGRARRMLDRYATPLRDARAQHSPVWAAVAEAWRVLGGSSEELVAESPRSGVSPRQPTKNNQTKGRKQR